jgi:hypothetical protein
MLTFNLFAFLGSNIKFGGKARKPAGRARIGGESKERAEWKRE